MGGPFVDWHLFTDISEREDSSQTSKWKNLRCTHGHTGRTAGYSNRREQISIKNCWTQNVDVNFGQIVVQYCPAKLIVPKQIKLIQQNLIQFYHSEFYQRNCSSSLDGVTVGHTDTIEGTSKLRVTRRWLGYRQGPPPSVSSIAHIHKIQNTFFFYLPRSVL
jgi:hypothetical protein